ncbi:RNA polymerase sigma factor (sigma-70 family) [Nocardia tenerifensis]|uniref:RNA polymerase sigma factor (Sigma-70 family) n=1 Tax=Nocardia tenerifensis TaxID=228006 RepID=A0A318JQR6_9NOCA|nr:sigma-70 family RNA polymerase sigma factor [Nocardia tenerifensis]PXX58071.1 RNA polymerase sigma factor (sigma-70 family) [Nocardia tenerifensis]
MTRRHVLANAERRFDDLFRTFSPAVFRFARREFRGDADRAHDIVQQVFTAVWQQYDRDFLGKPEVRKAQMIMTIAKRRVIDELRRTERILPLEEYDNDTVVPMFVPAAASENPAERVLNDDDLERFWHVLTCCLTASEYRVALMAWDLQLTDAEIASIVQTTVSTVYSHKCRARRKVSMVMNRGEDRIEFSPSSPEMKLPDREATRGGETTA